MWVTLEIRGYHPTYKEMVTFNTSPCEAMGELSIKLSCCKDEKQSLLFLNFQFSYSSNSVLNILNNGEFLIFLSVSCLN